MRTKLWVGIFLGLFVLFIVNITLAGILQKDTSWFADEQKQLVTQNTSGSRNENKTTPLSNYTLNVTQENSSGNTVVNTTNKTSPTTNSTKNYSAPPPANPAPRPTPRPVTRAS